MRMRSTPTSATVALGDASWLAEIGVSADARRLIADVVPATCRHRSGGGAFLGRAQALVSPAAGWWQQGGLSRRQVTKRVFEEILQGGYIAQALVPPLRTTPRGCRRGAAVRSTCATAPMPAAIQLVVARLYQGQTTNFRTPGGGFAPVFEVGGTAA
ncbi:MAG: hypothetical protein U1E85_08615 [Rhodocyclaceae bacterium]